MSGKTRGELEALRFSTAEHIQGLAELQVVEAHLGQQAKRSADRFCFGSFGEEGDRLAGRHLEDVVDRFAAVADGEDTLLVALPLALWAAEEKVTQELHLDLLEAESRAAVAAPLSRVE